VKTPAPAQVSSFSEAGDLAFLGLDMRAPPLVPAGFVSAATNARVVDGVYETRLGMFSPAWTRYASDDFPYRATYLREDDAAYAAAYATTYGAGLFSDPGEEGDTWLVRVCATALVFTRETEIGRIVAFGSGLSVTGPVQVVQNFNQLIITRGDDATSLVWSGAWVDPVEELVPDSIPSGYAAMPNAHYALAWRERLVLLADRDDLALGRIGDNTLFGNGTSSDLIYVNRGRGDRLRSAAPLGGQSLLVLKSQSLHVLTFAAADASDARLDSVPVDMQFDSPHTTCTADGRVWWLDRRGVRVAQIQSVNADNKVLVQVSVMSDVIAPLIRRINWAAAALFRAAVTEDRIYFAVALDSESTPQSLLVWNRKISAWESLDQWDTTTLADFAVLDFVAGVPWLNQPRLFAVGSDGRHACLDYQLGEDAVGWSGTLPVRADLTSSLTTRGYTAGTNDPKKFLRAQLQLDTWAPTATLSAAFDGPGETQTLAALARDRTKYFNRSADFDGTNSDGRFHDPKRQDYSLPLPSATPASGYADWTAGASYTATTSLVFVAATGRNYRARQNHTAAATTTPGDALEYWREMAYVGVGTPTWVAGSAYVPGTTVTYGSYAWECLVAHTASLGNDPVFHPEFWTDLGFDATCIPFYVEPPAAALSAYHSADVNRDGVISFTEFNRVLELYNYRSGTVRTGEYHEDATAYSGYAPGPGSITTYHSADTSQNGRLSLVELTRMIELYNSDGYHVQQGTEDGFAPGAEEPPASEGIRLEDFQTAVERRDLKREAAWCQLTLATTTGAIRLRSIALEVGPGSTSNLIHA
jgi:hypothetical protein